MAGIGTQAIGAVNGAPSIISNVYVEKTSDFFYHGLVDVNAYYQNLTQTVEYNRSLLEVTLYNT